MSAARNYPVHCQTCSPGTFSREVTGDFPAKGCRATASRPIRRRRGFTLLEVMFSLVILTVGLLSLLIILQRALQKSEPVEFETRAALLAQSILDGIRSDPSGFPFIPGVNPGTWPVIQKVGNGPEQPINSPYSRLDTLLLGKDGNAIDINRADGMRLPFVFSVPGDGVDNDALLDPNLWKDDGLGGGIAENGVDDTMDVFFSSISGTPPGSASKRDFDGGIQKSVSEYFLRGAVPEQDDDGDAIYFDTGDSAVVDLNTSEQLARDSGFWPDGDFSYDPQRGIDEELANGYDDDGDDLIDEDVRLSSQRTLDSADDDFDNNPYGYLPTFAGNGLDDDGDSTDWVDTNKSGRIDRGDEGVDPVTEKVMADGIDNNGDKRIDEGIDEEVFDTDDDDQDGSVDEDCRGAVMPFQPIPFPFPNDEYSWQISVRRVSVGGDGINNDGDLLGADEEYSNDVDDDLDGFIDEDVRAYPAPNAILVTVHIFQGDDRQDNDGDGWIDEEADDGIDNDGDAGLRGEGIDEDVYKREFRTTGLVKLPE